MNDLVQKTLRTPIEVALALDENLHTTASAVYNFLELDPAHFARWCKTNILENDYAEENVDFEAFTINGEWGGQKKTDYYLTANFAKKLCMASHSERGEEARNYFIGCETVLATRALPMIQKLENQLSELQNAVAVLKEESHKALVLGKLNDESIKVMQSGHSALPGGQLSENGKRLQDRVEKLAKSRRHYDGSDFTVKETLSEIIRVMQAELKINFNRYVDQYKQAQNLSKMPYRMEIIDHYDELASAFEDALILVEKQYNMYNDPLEGVFDLDFDII